MITIVPTLNICWLDTPACRDPARSGGKAANLALLAGAYPVPPGFCLTAAAYRRAALASPVPGLSPALYAELAGAYAQLAQRCGMADPPVAVRSSAVEEDSQAASFAGQHESYLNVRGLAAVAAAVRRCWASARGERVLAYRRARGLPLEGQGLAVLVQALIVADVAAIVFSADPRTGRRDQVVINATWGLGESLVAGTATPHGYVVARVPHLAIVDRQVGDPGRMTVAGPSGTYEVRVPPHLRALPALTDAQIAELARLACQLEAALGYPVDLECAYRDGQLALLQCRPITTLGA